MQTLQGEAKKISAEHMIVHQKDYAELCKSLRDGDKPIHFVFSIPHGTVGDKTVEGLRPYLKKGDVIIDCSNELWLNTERRQRDLDPEGIHYIGCGVSGGYQSARHGPSCSPGGSEQGLKAVMPFIRQIAAKDKQGRPCTTEVGPGGSGHYVKMVHNGMFTAARLYQRSALFQEPLTSVRPFSTALLTVFRYRAGYDVGNCRGLVHFDDRVAIQL